MRAGFVFLTLAYVLSQFFRSFLAVLSGQLEMDIGVSPADLSEASSYWFLAFALMQIPIGSLLDRVGPRETTAGLHLVGAAGGAALFAMATDPAHIKIAMALIGVGCAPVLMASYYIFARTYPPAVFATLGATVVGFGNLGNLAGAAPLALMAEAIGWRASLWVLASASAVIAVAIYVLVRNPPRLETTERGSLFDLFRLPALWLIGPMIFVSYAAPAGLRGVWIGPYFKDVLSADITTVGIATTVMSVAMMLGVFFYGPMDRIFGTRKWLNVFGTGAGAVICYALWAGVAGHGVWTATAVFSLLGFLTMTYPILMAHGRSFFPPHLAGRGITLLNLFSIGGAGVFQNLSGKVFTATGSGGVESYSAIFLTYAVALSIGLAIYLFSRDSME